MSLNFLVKSRPKSGVQKLKNNPIFILKIIGWKQIHINHFQNERLKLKVKLPRHNSAKNWPDIRPNFWPDLRQWTNPIFFKTHHQSSQLSGQELAGYTAGFYEIIPERILFKMAKIFYFWGILWKIITYFLIVQNWKIWYRWKRLSKY